MTGNNNVQFRFSDHLDPATLTAIVFVLLLNSPDVPIERTTRRIVGAVLEFIDSGMTIDNWLFANGCEGGVEMILSHLEDAIDN